MGRITRQNPVTTLTGTTVLTNIVDGGTILLTGSPGYTVTLADPTTRPGTTQTIINATSGNCSIAVSSGTITGSGLTPSTSFSIEPNVTYALTSSGQGYIITNAVGGQLAATSTVNLNPANAAVTISPTGTGTVTISPATLGSINNAQIGNTTAATARVTTLQATGTISADGGLSVISGSVAVSAGVTSTFSGPVIVPLPTLDTHAATRGFVTDRPVWVTVSPLPTQTPSIGSSYTFQLSALGAGITYSLLSGALPPTGSINASTGLISVTSAQSGTFSFTIRITNAFGDQDRAFTIQINAVAPPGQALFQGATGTAGGGTVSTWVAPEAVTSVSVAVIGGGGGGYYGWAVCGGAGGGLAWANGVPVVPGTPYTVRAGNGGCWSGSQGGCSCFPDIVACGGSCGCCGGSYTVGGAFSTCCGSCGMVAYPSTAGGGGGGGGYCNNLCNQNTSGYSGCHGGGGSATAYHSSTHGSGGGGGTGICGQGSPGNCGSASPGGHGTSGGGGTGGSGGSNGGQGEPYSNPYGNGFACGGNFGGGGGGGGTSTGGGWGGRGAVRIIWGAGRAYPSTGTQNV